MTGVKSDMPVGMIMATETLPNTVRVCKTAADEKFNSSEICVARKYATFVAYLQIPVLMNRLFVPNIDLDFVNVYSAHVGHFCEPCLIILGQNIRIFREDYKRVSI